MVRIKASAPCVRESRPNPCGTLFPRQLFLARNEAVAINADRVLIATAFPYQRAFHMRPVFVEEWSGSPRSYNVAKTYAWQEKCWYAYGAVRFYMVPLRPLQREGESASEMA